MASDKPRQFIFHFFPFVKMFICKIWTIWRKHCSFVHFDDLVAVDFISMLNSLNCQIQKSDFILRSVKFCFSTLYHLEIAEIMRIRRITWLVSQRLVSLMWYFLSFVRMFLSVSLVIVPWCSTTIWQLFDFGIASILFNISILSYMNAMVKILVVCPNNGQMSCKYITYLYL